MIREFNFKIDFIFWFLLLTPTFYLSGMQTRMIQLEFFKIAIIAMLAFFHSNRYIGLFLGYLVFVFVIFNDTVVKTDVVPNIFFACLLYHFILKHGTILKKHIWAFWGVLALSVFWIPIQMFQVDPVWSVRNPHLQTLVTEFSGWFTLPAFLGNYAAAVLPLAFLLTPVLIPIALVGLFFSKSTFSVIAALAGTLFVLWTKKRIFFWIVLSVFGLLAGFYIIKYDLPQGQFGRRLSAWNVLIKEGFKRQFFGHGIGSYGEEYHVMEFSPSLNNKLVTDNKQLLDFVADEVKAHGDNQLVGEIAKINPRTFNQQTFEQLRLVLQSKGMDFHEWMPAHNEFLQVFFDVGVVGVFIIGLYIFDIFRRFFKYAITDLSLCLMGSFVAILIISCAHFPFQIARLAAPFVALLAFLDLSLREDSNAAHSEVE